jgi:hypothetical protein
LVVGWVFSPPILSMLGGGLGCDFRSIFVSMTLYTLLPSASDPGCHRGRAGRNDRPDSLSIDRRQTRPRPPRGGKNADAGDAQANGHSQLTLVVVMSRDHDWRVVFGCFESEKRIQIDLWQLCRVEVGAPLSLFLSLSPFGRAPGE